MNQQGKKRNLLYILGNLDLSIATLFMFALIVITFAGVIFRYVVGNPFTWLEEVQRFFLIWIIFLSGGVAFRRGSHIAVELLVDAMPPKFQKTAEWLIRIVVVVILSFLMVQSVGYVRLFLNNGRVSPVLRIPQWLIYTVSPVGCVDMLISFVMHEVNVLRKSCQKSAKKEGQL